MEITDFRDLFRHFNEEAVEYLLVGAHAVIFYSEPRYTKDMDVWVRPTPENAARVYRALQRFTAALMGATEADFAEPDVIFRMGVPPACIDIMTSIDGVTFDEAWPNRVETTFGGEPITVISRQDLIRAKRAAGRPLDLADAARLEEG